MCVLRVTSELLVVRDAYIELYICDVPTFQYYSELLFVVSEKRSHIYLLISMYESTQGSFVR